MIYLDNAATTYPKPQCVYEAINEGMKSYSFNSGRGDYSEAKNTFKMINETRNKIANIVHVSSDSVIFTSSATESLNMIINGLGIVSGDTIFVSPFEHNAIMRPLNQTGANIIVLPFDKNTWSFDETAIDDLFIINKPKAIMISHISNVTGYELPYVKLFEIAKKYNVITVLDASQSFALIPILVNNCDYVIFAGHKSLYAMFGIAGFLKLGNDVLKVTKSGGTGSDSLNLDMPIDIPSRYEAGSFNSVGIYSVNKSIDFIGEEHIIEHERELSNHLLKELKKIDGVKVFYPNNVETNGIISFGVEGYSSDEIGILLSEEYDICVRTGYHCAPLIHEFIGSEKYRGTIRVSAGYFNSIDDINKLINAIKELLQ